MENILYLPNNSKGLNTIDGEVKIIGTAIVEVKVFNITRRVAVFIINPKSCRHDFILGLDLIPTFRLNLNYELKLTQSNCENNNNNNASKSSSDDSRENKNLSTDNNKKKNITSSDEHIKTRSNCENNENNNNNNEVNFNEFIPIERFEAKIEHLDGDKKKILENLISEYSSVFAKDAFDVGSVKDHEARIILFEDRLVTKKPYRCSFQDQAEIERQVAALLEKGLVQESLSPYASPVTMQFKKSGESGQKEKTRMCIDYKDLNRLILPDPQPMPLIDEIVARTAGCSWFSGLDINSAFWSIPIRQEDRHKTGFVTQHGNYEWSCLPFGLKNAPGTFQRILSGIIRKHRLMDFCVNYIDDILIFSKSFEEHIEHLRSLISAIIREGFRLKLVKCNFARQSIEYLGHEIGPDYVKPLNDNLAAINKFPQPKTRRNVRQFLGKINFYLKFIPNASSLLEPFHRLLRKNVPFQWTSECQRVFDSVKNLLTSAPILAIFDSAKPITIYTDASAVGIGAVLKQTQEDGSEKPVAYFSRKLSEAQRKRKAIYVESLAIWEAIRFWKYWLIGRKFKVVTDHQPLAGLNLKARPDEELGDLANELLQFDFEISYRKGTLNSEADCLSRNPVSEPVSPEDEEPALPTANLITIEDIKTAQENITPLPSDEEKAGILFRQIKGKKRILINPELGKRLISTVHERFGHIGQKHVSLILSKSFHFNGMTAHIRDHCRRCDVCKRNKTRRPQPFGKMGHFGPATKPFQIMSLDTIGGFGGNRSTKKYLHLLVDHFTRYAYILCTKGQSASEMITLVRSVHENHPIGTLLTDQYGGLSSDEFEGYCHSAGICHVLVAVDAAFSNGLNERLNQTLVNRIRCRTNDGNDRKCSWATIAQRCVNEYNNTPHSVTTFAPSYLLNGCSSRLIPSILIDPPDLEADRKIAFEKSNENHNYNKIRYDSKKRDISLDVGDEVYIDNGSKLNRSKLEEVRIGPFKISRKLCSTVYEVDVGRGPFPKRLYHISKMLL